MERPRFKTGARPYFRQLSAMLAPLKPPGGGCFVKETVSKSSNCRTIVKQLRKDTVEHRNVTDTAFRHYLKTKSLAIAIPNSITLRRKVNIKNAATPASRRLWRRGKLIIYLMQSFYIPYPIFIFTFYSEQNEHLQNRPSA